MSTNSASKRLVAWALIAIGVVLALWLLGPVLTPFAVGAVFAYALRPLVERLVRMGWKPMLAVTVVELVFILAVLGVMLLIVPILATELPQIRQQLPSLLDRAHAAVAPWLAQLGLGASLDPEVLKAKVMQYLNSNYSDVLAPLLSSLKLGGSFAAALIGNLVLIPVALFYLLLDWEGFVAHVRQLVPPRLQPKIDSFTKEADEILGQYLRGQLLVKVIMSIFYSVALALFGLDLALPIGVFSALVMLIPYVGFGVGVLLALLAGVLQFAVVKGLIMVAVVYGIGQSIEGLFLTPRFVGKRIGLHPLALIFALLAFGQLFGFVGVLVALPASAVTVVAIRRARAGYLGSAFYRE